MKVLFLDLDKTLIETISGDKFPNDYKDWKFIETVKDNVLKYFNLGYSIVIVTNQGGIAFNIVTEEELNIKFETISMKMNIPMKFYYSKTNNKNDLLRKPNIGMFELAEKDLGKIDKENSIMVGDASGLEGQFSDSDKMFAINAGIGTYYDVEEFKKL